MVNSNGGGSGAAASSQNSENMDALKQEILSEMRREIQKAKLEIIDGEW